jgi:multidrug resistance efflux pump
MNVQMGDKVTSGQVLLELYIPNAEQRLAEARSALASAESALYQVRSAGKTSDLIAAEIAFSQAESTYEKDKVDLQRQRPYLKRGNIQSALEQAQVNSMRQIGL